MTTSREEAEIRHNIVKANLIEHREETRKKTEEILKNAEKFYSAIKKVKKKYKSNILTMKIMNPEKYIKIEEWYKSRCIEYRRKRSELKNLLYSDCVYRAKQRSESIESLLNSFEILFINIRANGNPEAADRFKFGQKMRIAREILAKGGKDTNNGNEETSRISK